MKNTLIAFALVTTFVACKNKQEDARNIQFISDSSAYNNDLYSDTSNMEIATEAVPVSVKPHSVTSSKATSTTTSTTNTTPASTTGTQSTTTQTTTAKKGWSSAAKGAVIGGGVGAIGGAIISKKKPVKGAIIGGVAGAAGGYIIGKDIDKKKNR
ncbi:MAG: YMGG-like glycine zipper-containing protein [Ginsengibacter sp.]